jgi:serine/threonine protein kinase
MTIIGKVLRQLCLALDFLQRIGIANRDVHPENIFLTRGGTVKLGHFGQARAVFKEEDENSELWACKTPVGHEEFMAFEKVY